MFEVRRFVKSVSVNCVLQWKMGNWSVEFGGNVHSASRNSVLQVQAKFDRSEHIWLQTTLGKRCLQVAAGYASGQNSKLLVFPFHMSWLCTHSALFNLHLHPDSSDDLRMTLCLEGNHWLTFKSQRGGSGIENETLALISMGAVDRGLVFRAKGCEACLAATEVGWKVDIFP